jgi:site-specific DNA-methyltransferase (adenine-specific)
MPETAKCEHFYTPENNGLIQDWTGHTVFCNPPYNEVNHWVKKCHDESQKGSTVVMLIPARTDTKYFHDYIYGKAEIRFLKGRLKFGNAKHNAPFPSMVVVYKKVLA